MKNTHTCKAYKKGQYLSEQERDYSDLSLASLEITSRNEEESNSTWNGIYSLNDFYFLLYQRRYFLFVSQLM